MDSASIQQSFPVPVTVGVAVPIATGGKSFMTVNIVNAGPAALTNFGVGASASGLATDVGAQIVGTADWATVSGSNFVRWATAGIGTLAAGSSAVFSLDVRGIATINLYASSSTVGTLKVSTSSL